MHLVVLPGRIYPFESRIGTFFYSLDKLFVYFWVLFEVLDLFLSEIVVTIHLDARQRSVHHLLLRWCDPSRRAYEVNQFCNILGLALVTDTQGI